MTANKTVYTQIFLKQLGIEPTDNMLKVYMPMWWQNTRKKSEGGLRLTEEGLNVVNQLEIATHKIPFPHDMKMTTQVIIFLDKFIDCPYYISNDSITVTNERKAVELALFSGDLRKYGYAKALSRKKTAN